MGGLGVFLGLPDRHHENICWLMNFYDNFGLVLGSSWGLLGASWAVLGASWCLLGASWRPLGELLGAFVAYQRVQDAICCICIMVKRSAYFSSGSTKSTPGGFLSASWGLLGVSWRQLGRSWSILEASWRSLGNHIGPLEALKAKMLIFHWFYKGLAAQVPWHGCQQGSGPEPWRGVGGRHKSLPQGLGLGLVWICCSYVIYTP